MVVGRWRERKRGGKGRAPAAVFVQPLLQIARKYYYSQHIAPLIGLRLHGFGRLFSGRPVKRCPGGRRAVVCLGQTNLTNAGNGS